MIALWGEGNQISLLDQTRFSPLNPDKCYFCCRTEPEKLTLAVPPKALARLLLALCPPSIRERPGLAACRRWSIPEMRPHRLLGLNPLDSRVGFRSWVKRTGINEMKGEPFQDVFEHFFRETCGTTFALEFFEDDLQSADNSVASVVFLWSF